jgi:chromosomal replication initiator protein
MKGGKEIIDAICVQYRVPRRVLDGLDRTKGIVEARHECMRRLYETDIFSMAQIGRMMGGRDHTSVSHGVKKARERLDGR